MISIRCRFGAYPYRFNSNTARRRTSGELSAIGLVLVLGLFGQQPLSAQDAGETGIGPHLTLSTTADFEVFEGDTAPSQPAMLSTTLSGAVPVSWFSIGLQRPVDVMLMVPLGIGWTRVSDPDLETTSIDDLNMKIGLDAIFRDAGGRTYIGGFDATWISIGNGYAADEALRWSGRLLYITPVSDQLVLNFGAFYVFNLYNYPLPIVGANWNPTPRWTLSAILPVQVAISFRPNPASKIGIKASPAGFVTITDAAASPFIGDQAEYSSRGVRVALEYTRYRKNGNGQFSVEIGTTLLRSVSISSGSDAIESERPPSLYIGIKAGL